MRKKLLLLGLLLSLNLSHADDLPSVTPVDNDYGWAWGKKPKDKDDPVVPEPDAYGIYMAIGITTFLLTRRKR